MVVEVVLDRERLHELHRRLRPDLGHAVEKEDVLLRVLRVVEVVGVELEWKRREDFIIQTLLLKSNFQPGVYDIFFFAPGKISRNLDGGRRFLV